MIDFNNKIHNGIPITEIEIIDLHAHLGPNGIMHIPACSAESMVKLMDLCGIDKTVLSPNAGLDTDIVIGNNIMLKSIRKHRGRIYGACMVNGNYPELSLSELERCFEEENDVKMIKIHPFFTRCSMKDKRMKKIYDFAAARKLPVLVHAWLDGDPYGSQDTFAAIAKEYSDANWIMGHSGGPFGSYHAVELAKECESIYLDIALSMVPARQVEFFVNEIGSHRVLFASDSPYIDPRPQIGRVGLADISYQDKINIFNANARRLIKF